MKFKAYSFMGLIILMGSVSLQGASVARVIGRLTHPSSPVSLLGARSLHVTPRLCSENIQESQKEEEKEVRRFVEGFERLRAEAFCFKKRWNNVYCF